MVTEKVALVIPALNEEAALHRLLAELPPNCAQWVIVVDNGSTDATAAVAQRSGAIVASEPLRGYGRACWKGFKTACGLGAAIVMLMDGDGSDDPCTGYLGVVATSDICSEKRHVENDLTSLLALALSPPSS